MRTPVERRALVAGGALVTAGVLFNRWLLGGVFSVDGAVSSAESQGLIWVIQAVLLILGAAALVSGLYTRRIGRLAAAGHSLVLASVGFFVASVVAFAFLEVAYPLLPRWFINTHPYYSARSQYESDPELAFRRRPHSVWELTFKGEFYHPKINVPVEDISIRAVHDANGHIDHNARTHADVVMVRSSTSSRSGGMRPRSGPGSGCSASSKATTSPTWPGSTPGARPEGPTEDRATSFGRPRETRSCATAWPSTAR